MKTKCKHEWQKAYSRIVVFGGVESQYIVVLLCLKCTNNKKLVIQI